MEDYYLLIILLGFLFVFWILGIQENKRRIKREKEKIRTKYGKMEKEEILTERLSSISRYYEKKKKSYSIDEITWNDLSMDKLFSSINYTFSSAGEEYLYYRLRTPIFSGEKLKKMEEKILFFMEHPREREDFLLAMAKCGKTGKHSLCDYMEFVKSQKEESGAKHYFCGIFFLISFAIIFFHTGIGIWMLLITLSYNIFSYYHAKREMLPYLVSLRYVLKLVQAGDRVGKMNLLAFSKELEEIRSTVEVMKHFSSNGTYVFSSHDGEGSISSVFMAYVNMVLHLDFIFFHKMMKQMKESEKEIFSLIRNLGFMEATVAIGSFRTALPAYAIPQFGQKESANGIYHPLLKNPVKNDYQLDKSMLITGSNASGKSTFLRTVAINVLLAQTIHTTCSDCFHTAFHRIYTSMALKDNLFAGESYYIVEIKAIKRIIDGAKEEGPGIICFVDEVLRGTNTVERIAASSQILKYLTQVGVLCVAATHDEELTGILEKDFANFHFKEELKGQDVLFHYKILPGKAETKNAILLLKMLGYEDAIVEDAKALANNFEKNNSWKAEG